MVAITALVLIGAVITITFSAYSKNEKRENVNSTSNTSSMGSSATSSKQMNTIKSAVSTSGKKSVSKYSPFPDSVLGYTAILPLKDEIDDFEYGVDLPYNRDPYNKHPELKNSSPHY